MVYRLLVVEDEAFALTSILETIDWRSLQIIHVYGASDAAEARAVMVQQDIDVVICDIEMPGENGLDLLKWMRQRNSLAETIFLTGHDKFAYAQEALQSGCFDYLLKPVDHDRLKQTVAAALDKLDKRHMMDNARRRLDHYEQLIQTQKRSLIDRFWTETIEQGGQVCMTDAFKAYISMLDPGFSAEDDFLPVLISVDRWERRFGSRDEGILEYAIMNSAQETVLRDWPGTVVKSRSGAIFIIIYRAKTINPSSVELTWRCRRLIADCNQYFYSHISCYIGLAGPISVIATDCMALLDMEQRNVSKSDSVFIQGGPFEEQGEVSPVAWPSELAVLFEAGKKEELLRRLDELFSLYESKKTFAKENMKAFYYHFASMIYHSLHKCGISVDHTLPMLNRHEDMAQATKSLSQLREWASNVIDTAMRATVKHRNKQLSIVEIIERYIESHLSQDVTREEIASFLHFNPAYLSRMFKKETGHSLTDYIIDVRMKQAKRLLSESDLKVSDVAEITGYHNFSYFSKLFKKQEGFTPQEFRKQTSRRNKS